MKRFLKLLMLSASLGFLYSEAHAVDFTVIPQVPQSVFIDGEIQIGDDVRLQRLFNYRKKHHFETLSIILNSGGGNLKTALAMADIISREHLVMGVGPGQQCSSACVLLFAAGDHRLVSVEAAIAVHQASDITATGAAQSTQAMAAAFMRYHVPPQIIQDMTATPGDKIYSLTANDLSIWPNTVIMSQDQ